MSEQQEYRITESELDSLPHLSMDMVLKLYKEIRSRPTIPRMQSHKCAYLDSPGDRCRSDEYCQYKLTTACSPLEPQICGKNQALAILAVGGEW